MDNFKGFFEDMPNNKITPHKKKKDKKEEQINYPYLSEIDPFLSKNPNYEIKPENQVKQKILNSKNNITGNIIKEITKLPDKELIGIEFECCSKIDNTFHVYYDKDGKSIEYLSYVALKNRKEPRTIKQDISKFELQGFNIRGTFKSARFGGANIHLCIDAKS